MAFDEAHSESSLPVFMESLSFSNEHPPAPRLLPVQHLIFDILEKEIPLKLLRVSKPLYSRIIPTIYKQVTLTNDNIVPFFQGLIIQKKQDGNGKTTFTLGERKLKVLSHVESIKFIDRPTAEKFSKMMKFFANQVHHSSESPMVLPSVVDVHLGTDLVDVLFTTFDDMTRPETISMMLSVWIPMFLFALGKHAQPSIFSIDWPLEWSGDKDIDFWDEPGLPLPPTPSSKN
ncbi:uncharacterized protein L199_002424 [Kwoniella botswanensis]|uniref:uncharacterized protein n=1 Tax=Kwoniella botswanensis TaxID=1268659 RepID=UPI00315CBB83